MKYSVGGTSPKKAFTPALAQTSQQTSEATSAVRPISISTSKSSLATLHLKTEPASKAKLSRTGESILLKTRSKPNHRILPTLIEVASTTPGESSTYYELPHSSWAHNDEEWKTYLKELGEDEHCADHTCNVLDIFSPSSARLNPIGQVECKFCCSNILDRSFVRHVDFRNRAEFADNKQIDRLTGEQKPLIDLNRLFVDQLDEQRKIAAKDKCETGDSESDNSSVAKSSDNCLACKCGSSLCSSRTASSCSLELEPELKVPEVDDIDLKQLFETSKAHQPAAASTGPLAVKSPGPTMGDTEPFEFLRYELPTESIIMSESSDFDWEELLSLQYRSKKPSPVKTATATDEAKSSTKSNSSEPTKENEAGKGNDEPLPPFEESPYLKQTQDIDPFYMQSCDLDSGIRDNNNTLTTTTTNSINSNSQQSLSLSISKPKTTPKSFSLLKGDYAGTNVTSANQVKPKSVEKAKGSSSAGGGGQSKLLSSTGKSKIIDLNQMSSMIQRSPTTASPSAMSTLKFPQLPSSFSSVTCTITRPINSSSSLSSSPSPSPPSQVSSAAHSPINDICITTPPNHSSSSISSFQSLNPTLYGTTGDSMQNITFTRMMPTTVKHNTTTSASVTPTQSSQEAKGAINKQATKSKTPRVRKRPQKVGTVIKQENQECSAFEGEGSHAIANEAIQSSERQTIRQGSVTSQFYAIIPSAGSGDEPKIVSTLPSVLNIQQEEIAQTFKQEFTDYIDQIDNLDFAISPPTPPLASTSSPPSSSAPEGCIIQNNDLIITVTAPEATKQSTKPTQTKTKKKSPTSTTTTQATVNNHKSTTPKKSTPKKPIKQEQHSANMIVESLTTQTPEPPSTSTTSTSEATSSTKPTDSDNKKRFSLCHKRQYNPDEHCGVIKEEDDEVCKRSLTCRYHSKIAKRAVLGRSQLFDELLKVYVEEHRIPNAGAKYQERQQKKLEKLAQAAAIGLLQQQEKAADAAAAEATFEAVRAQIEAEVAEEMKPNGTTQTTKAAPKRKRNKKPSKPQVAVPLVNPLEKVDEFMFSEDENDLASFNLFNLPDLSGTGLEADSRITLLDASIDDHSMELPFAFVDSMGRPLLQLSHQLTRSSSMDDITNLMARGTAFELDNSMPILSKSNESLNLLEDDDEDDDAEYENEQLAIQSCILFDPNARPIDETVYPRPQVPGPSVVASAPVKCTFIAKTRSAHEPHPFLMGFEEDDEETNTTDHTEEEGEVELAQSGELFRYIDADIDVELPADAIEYDIKENNVPPFDISDFDNGGFSLSDFTTDEQYFPMLERLNSHSQSSSSSSSSPSIIAPNQQLFPSIVSDNRQLAASAMSPVRTRPPARPSSTPSPSSLSSSSSSMLIQSLTSSSPSSPTSSRPSVASSVGAKSIRLGGHQPFSSMKVSPVPSKLANMNISASLSPEQQQTQTPKPVALSLSLPSQHSTSIRVAPSEQSNTSTNQQLSTTITNNNTKQNSKGAIQLSTLATNSSNYQLFADNQNVALHCIVPPILPSKSLVDLPRASKVTSTVTLSSLKQPIAAKLEAAGKVTATNNNNNNNTEAQPKTLKIVLNPATLTSYNRNNNTNLKQQTVPRAKQQRSQTVVLNPSNPSNKRPMMSSLGMTSQSVPSRQTSPSPAQTSRMATIGPTVKEPRFKVAMNPSRPTLPSTNGTLRVQPIPRAQSVQPSSSMITSPIRTLTSPASKHRTTPNGGGMVSSIPLASSSFGRSASLPEPLRQDQIIEDIKVDLIQSYEQKRRSSLQLTSPSTDFASVFAESVEPTAWPTAAAAAAAVGSDILLNNLDELEYHINPDVPHDFLDIVMDLDKVPNGLSELLDFDSPDTQQSDTQNSAVMDVGAIGLHTMELLSEQNRIELDNDLLLGDNATSMLSNIIISTSSAATLPISGLAGFGVANFDGLDWSNQPAQMSEAKSSSKSRKRKMTDTQEQGTNTTSSTATQASKPKKPRVRNSAAKRKQDNNSSSVLLASPAQSFQVNSPQSQILAPTDKPQQQQQQQQQLPQQPQPQPQPKSSAIFTGNIDSLQSSHFKSLNSAISSAGLKLQNSKKTYQRKSRAKTVPSTAEGSANTDSTVQSVNGVSTVAGSILNCQSVTTVASGGSVGGGHGTKNTTGQQQSYLSFSSPQTIVLPFGSLVGSKDGSMVYLMQQNPDGTTSALSTGPGGGGLVATGSGQMVTLLQAGSSQMRPTSKQQQQQKQQPQQQKQQQQKQTLVSVPFVQGLPPAPPKQ